MGASGARLEMWGKKGERGEGKEGEGEGKGKTKRRISWARRVGLLC